jgi:chromosome partitioning protein
MQMIITVAGFKGGVGKSTTAVHLAAYFGKKYGDTLLVDGDPNRSSLSWSQRGKLPFSVCDLLGAAKTSKGKSYIVIDTAARPVEDELETLAEGCDLLILPTTPDALAMEALIATVEKLVGLKSVLFGCVLTMVDARKMTTAKEARSTLVSIGVHVFPGVIRRLTAYEKAALTGVPVYDACDRLSGAAWSEYENLGKEIEKYVGKTKHV